MNREERKLWYYEQTHRTIDGVIHKQCTKCKEWLPDNTEYFYMHNKSKLEKGFQSECKKCASKRTIQTKRENRDRYLKYDKNRYRKDREKHKAASRRIKEGKREYYRQLSREYRYSEKGKEKFKEYQKKRKNKKHEIYNIEWKSCKEYFNNQCAYCGLPIEEHYLPYKGGLKLYDLHKDHVVYDGKNDLRNCIPACYLCNIQKNTNSFGSFYNLDNPNYTYERYHKIYKWIKYDHKKYIMPKRRYKGQRLNARLKEIEENKS